MKAEYLSKAAKRVCRQKHFTPREFEVLNADKPACYIYGDAEYPVLRVWNSRRSIEITNFELAYA
jgi:hypothetical protein